MENRDNQDQQSFSNTVRTRVLIVEDSATQRELLKHTLEQHGFDVIPATDAQEALKFLDSFKPDLIISDILMPGMDGFELCRRIKAKPTLRSIPLILLTALDDSRDVLHGLACGADNFIVKPFQEKNLLARVHQILANLRIGSAEERGQPLSFPFRGEEFQIRAERRQIMNFLLAAYEAAVEKNSQLQAAQEQLHAANTDLESKVQERTASLQQAYKSLESFSYSIAHDLRAPLRSIQGFTSLLLKEYGGIYDDTGRDFSKRVIEAAERMDQLIHDLLSFGRISHAEFPLGPVSLQEVIERVLPQFAEELRHRQAEIQVEGPLPNVRANSTLLEQVFVNLLSNGLKYARDHVPPRINVRAARSSAGIRTSIQDNGIGIASAHLERIFRVFERLHGTKKYPGTGIGLVIVRLGVERMGGRVGVESEPGKGSTFWFELPPA